MKTAQKHLSKKNLIVVITGLLITSLLTLKITTTVFAQDKKVTNNTNNKQQISLTAIPPRLGEDNSLKASPGEKLQVQLRVKNLSDQTVDVVSSVQDFILGEDGSTPIAINDSVSNRWSLASWVTITPTQNILKPRQTIGLNILIDIPKDALPGGHYAMVLHQPQKANANFKTKNISESAVNQRVGTLLYVVVDGPINEEAYVRNFTFPKFTEYGPIPFSFTIENNSDVHITPQMNIEIFDIFHRKVNDIKVNQKNIFPLTSRDFNGEWQQIWGTGFYTARLTASYGSNGSVMIANTSFWLLPIKLIIAITVALLVILILILSIKRHLNYRKNMDQKKISELENQIQKMNSVWSEDSNESESENNH